MIEIKLKDFPLHVSYTNNKKASNKFIKVNNQSVYNGKINRFSRATVMENLKIWFLRYFPKKLKIEKFPVKIHYIFKTVINHGDISRRNNKLIWKYPSEDYVPRWDIENLASIFIKSGNDSLVRAKILPDDSIKYVNGISYEFIKVDDINDREIIIQII